MEQASCLWLELRTVFEADSMKAEEVLKRYRAEEKNFQGKNLLQTIFQG
jgi:hypothetical protein